MKDQETGWYHRVHPVFRILCFIVFSLSLVLANVGQLIFSAVILLALYLSINWDVLFGAMRMLRRLRWFFLSIVIIYGYLTPGPAVFGFENAWGMPSSIGLMLGGQRLLALIMIVMAVHWLLAITRQEQLVAALYWLAKPFVISGVSRERLAVRIALVLELVPRVQEVVEKRLAERLLTKRVDIRAYAAILVGMVTCIFERAEKDVVREIVIDISDPPPLAQWLWPIALVLLMLLAGQLV